MTIKKYKVANKKISNKDIILAFGLAVIIVLAFFIYVNFLPKPLFISNKISVDIIEINGDCEKCFDLTAIKNNILQNDFGSITQKTLDYKSDEAVLLINKYDIKRIPTLIIKSKKIEIIMKSVPDKDLFSIKEKSAIFDKSVPYINLKDNKIYGIVDLKEIYDSFCKECASISNFQKQLEQLHVKINSYEAVDILSESGKNIVEKYNLDFVPVLLITKEIEEYWWLFDNLKINLIELDEYYLLKSPMPPYNDMKTGEIKGKVNIKYILDKSCTDCFNVTQLKSGFESLGVYIDSEEYIDISNFKGKELLNKYNISKVPTVILSKEISDYKPITPSLKDLGTFEEDKSFVFRELDKLNLKYQKID
ncbi:hypothetical protein GOV12_04150 [Candidatus Pacearchaeota archaeon]|nr:hypothetical protein [Candidatus Pacearchaeota archaeon]